MAPPDPWWKDEGPWQDSTRQRTVGPTVAGRVGRRVAWQPKLLTVIHTIRRYDENSFGEEFSWALAVDADDWTYAEGDETEYDHDGDSWVIETWQRTAVKTRTYFPQVIIEDEDGEEMQVIPDYCVTWPPT